MMRKMNIIVAMEKKKGIGKDNDLPWKLRKEFKQFLLMIRSLEDPTKQNALVMGRKTWESIQPPLSGTGRRLRVIITSQKDYVAEGENMHVVHSLDEALELLSAPPFSDTVETIWNLGGASVYRESLEKDYIDKLFITRIRKDFDADVFFPKYDEDKFVAISDPKVPEDVQEENGVEWTYHVYQRK